MRKTIKANFINGTLVPLEPCDLNDGDEVLVQVHVANGTTAKPGIEQPDVMDKPAEAPGQAGEDEPSASEGSFNSGNDRGYAKANIPEHLE